MWVANAGDDTVTRIDAATAKAAGDPLAVGDDPIGVAVGGGSVVDDRLPRRHALARAVGLTPRDAGGAGRAPAPPATDG